MFRPNGPAHVFIAIVLGAVLGGCAVANDNNTDVLSKVQHIVVVFDENHSFDNLYGSWEGVNGLASADSAHTIQVAQNETPYICLAQNDVNLTSPPQPAARCGVAAGGLYNSHFANAPFQIDAYIPSTATTCPAPGVFAGTGVANGSGLPGGCTEDLVHRFYQGQYQLNGGKENQFVTGSDAIGLTMGVYYTQRLPIYIYLHQADHPNYAILDNFFQAAFGGSFLNHQWLIAAKTPTWIGAPDDQHALVDSKGFPNAGYLLYKPDPNATYRDTGALTVACRSPHPAKLACGDYAVNTIQPAFQPTSEFGNPKIARLPAQTGTTIGDRLSDKGIDWAWYAGGWANADGEKGKPGWTNGNGPTCSDPNSMPNPAFPYCPDKVFQFHHQPFNYYLAFSDETRAGKANRAAHLRDEADFSSLVSSSREECKLKPVSFVKPIGQENEHPGYASETAGSDHLVGLVQAIEGSSCKNDTMVILTYDEFGGQWDHVAPPGQARTSGAHDVWGPGPRVPALVVSAFLKGSSLVDHSQYDTTSILATIEHRFGLMRLSSRDAAVQDLSPVFVARPAATLAQPNGGRVVGITVTQLVMGSLALAFAVIVARCIEIDRTHRRPRIRVRFRLKKRMGSPGWDFTKSWASNFTVVGAVLGTIVGATGVIPDETQFFPKGSYSALNLVFGALVVLAPFFYLAAQKPVSSHTRYGDKADQPQGYVWSFLLTTMITLWAVLGELGTIILLVYEIRSAGSLPTGVTHLFAGAMALAGLLVLWYLWNGIPGTIREQSNHRHHVAAIRAQMRSASALYRPPAKHIVPPLPTWSVF